MRIIIFSKKKGIKINNLLEKCPECKYDSRVEYLGIIREENENFKLFRCKRKCEAHRNTIYFKYSKKSKLSKIIDFDTTLGKSKELEKRKLLKRRIKCPKYEEHIDKSKKDHEFIFVRSFGNSIRHYCINHKPNTNNRYEFKDDKAEKLTINKFLVKHSYELKKKLQEIYSKRHEKDAYDFIFDELHITELLFKIGFSDNIIAKIFGTSQSKINNLKRSFNHQKIQKFGALKSTNNHIFYWVIKDVKKENINKLHKLIKEYKFKITDEINIITDDDNY